MLVFLFLSANVTNVQGDRETVHGIDGVVHVVAEHVKLYIISGIEGAVHIVGDHHVYGPRTTCTMHNNIHCTWSMAQIHSLFVAHRLLSPAW